MSANISCPHCRGILGFDPALAGQVVSCPYCQNQFQMPRAAPPAPRAAAPQSVNPFESPAAPEFNFGEQEDPSPKRLSRTRAKNRVKAPAILMMVYGSLVFALMLFGMIVDIAGITPRRRHPDPEIQRMLDAMMEPTTRLTIGVITMIGPSIVFWGGWKMLEMDGAGWPTAGALLAMLPCTAGCCCFVGLPLGIWSLVLLSDPEVRRAMSRSGSRHRYRR